MRKLALLVCLSLLTLPLMAQDWVDFRTERCLCKMRFPAYPELTDEAMGDYSSHQATASLEDAIFMLDYGVLPEPIQAAESWELAQVSLQEFYKAMNGKLLKQKKWKVKGYEGIRARIEVPEKGLVADYYVVVVRSIHYQLIVTGEGESQKKARKKFLKSFKIL